jgi:hypothetical protein
VWTAEVEALRDAVCKHIAMETSIRVHVPVCTNHRRVTTWMLIHHRLWASRHTG